MYVTGLQCPVVAFTSDCFHLFENKCLFSWCVIIMLLKCQTGPFPTGVSSQQGEISAIFSSPYENELMKNQSK